MTLPLPRIVIGFDFGMKRIGVAIGQTITQSTNALTTLAAKNGQPNWQEIATLTKKWRPDAFIIGIPLNMDGTEQPISKQVRNFANHLQKQFALPVYEIDERLTTKAAREELFAQGGFKALQGGQVDRLAAQLIIQNWFATYLK